MHDFATLRATGACTRLTRPAAAIVAERARAAIVFGCAAALILAARPLPF